MPTASREPSLQLLSLSSPLSARAVLLLLPLTLSVARCAAHRESRPHVFGFHSSSRREASVFDRRTHPKQTPLIPPVHRKPASQPASRPRTVGNYLTWTHRLSLLCLFLYRRLSTFADRCRGAATSLLASDAPAQSPIDPTSPLAAIVCVYVYVYGDEFLPEGISSPAARRTADRPVRQVRSIAIAVAACLPRVARARPSALRLGPFRHLSAVFVAFTRATAVHSDRRAPRPRVPIEAASWKFHVHTPSVARPPLTFSRFKYPPASFPKPAPGSFKPTRFILRNLPGTTRRNGLTTIENYTYRAISGRG